MRCIASQPRYLPVISYLQRIAYADVFILYDIAQRQQYGWEQRNKLIIQNTPVWLSVPIKGTCNQFIYDTKIDNNIWIKKHKKSIIVNYAKHPFYDIEIIEKYYKNLYEMIENNCNFTECILQTIFNIFDILDIKVNIVIASNIADSNIMSKEHSERVCEIAKKCNVDTFISGSNGRVYNIEDGFKNSNIKVLYNDPINPQYKQPNQKEFIPFMGLFDYLFCMGVDEVRKIVTSPLILIDK